MSVPIVQTENGYLRGTINRSIEGYEYCAFKGIPYAEPPIGDLRFKDPVPLKSWVGIRDAMNYGPMCRQYDYVSRSIQGSADCLYLNVYVKSIKPECRLPVMVWIHGGGFTCGYSDDTHFGPDYLLRKNIVLVTFNYRLGVFGFLNLEDEVAPGNQGFKDQVMVLKWVQQNIEKFGGDRNNITVFGESAGSVSVHYLVLSRLSKGLIHKAISQSCVAFNNWSVVKEPKKYAIQLCKFLGKDVQDSQQIIKFLKTVDSLRLVQGQETIRKSCEKLMTFIPFGPGVDHKSMNPFMPVPVEEAALEGVHIPYLLGHNSCEGICCLIALPKDVFPYVDTNFDNSIQPGGLDVLERYNLSPKDLRRLYFQDSKITQASCGAYVAMCSDLYFIEGIHRTLKVQAEKSSAPTYYYKFSYAEQLTIMRALLQYPVTGACHFDDVEYLFYVKLRKQFGFNALKKGTSGYTVMQRMTEMWTNFATHGSPIPTTSELLPTHWLPINNGSNLRYLNINKRLQMETVPNIEQHFLSAKYVM